MKRAAFDIFENVVVHTPLWSGQARLNWTANVGASKGGVRIVNVPRSNAKIRKASKGKSFGSVGSTLVTTKVSQGRGGSFNDIEVDEAIANSAASVAISAIRQVVEQYKHPVRPSNFLSGPRQSRGGQRTPSVYLSNALPYIAKLWSGTWPSNPRTLDQELEFGRRTVARFRGKLLTRM